MNDSSHEKRMRDFAARVPPQEGNPAYPAFASALEWNKKNDIRFRLGWKEIKSSQRPFILTRMKGGSRFPVSKQLRAYFLEFYDRFTKHGAHSFPTSFNVVEGFMKFSEKYIAFDLLPEREYLLRLENYLKWYSMGAPMSTPAALADIMDEGITYSFNMVGSAPSATISTIESELLILGIAMARHGNELSIMLIGGEQPANPSDQELANRDRELLPASGREWVEPDPSYTLQSRYLEEAPDHSRVILLSRFNLLRARHDIRYIHLDTGLGYDVITDDINWLSCTFSGSSTGARTLA